MPPARLPLICGVIASALYIGADLFAAFVLYPGYDYASQQVSELSAIGAPTRGFWVNMGYVYAALMAAFCAGAWQAADRTSLRVAAVLIFLFTLNSLLWGLAPMNQRATEFTLTDVMHIVFAGSAVLLMTGFIIAGAIGLGRGFRIYSAATVVAMLTAGGIVGTQVSAIAAGEPTPWLGLIERVSVYAPILWIAVFALTLLRREAKA